MLPTWPAIERQSLSARRSPADAELDETNRDHRGEHGGRSGSHAGEKEPERLGAARIDQAVSRTSGGYRPRLHPGSMR